MYLNFVPCLQLKLLEAETVSFGSIQLILISTVWIIIWKKNLLDISETLQNSIFGPALALQQSFCSNISHLCEIVYQSKVQFQLKLCYRSLLLEYCIGAQILDVGALFFLLLHWCGSYLTTHSNRCVCPSGWLFLSVSLQYDSAKLLHSASSYQHYLAVWPLGCQQQHPGFPLPLHCPLQPSGNSQHQDEDCQAECNGVGQERFPDFGGGRRYAELVSPFQLPR